MAKNQSKRVLVVGGGAAGIMAAGIAAVQGAQVILFEKKSRLGRKLLLTGKGRCNLTNIAPMPEFVENYPSNGAFLYGPLNAFSNQDFIEFLGNLGLSTKIERGGRVFPSSDRSLDVLRTLERFLKNAGVKVSTGKKVTGILVEKRVNNQQRVSGIMTDDGKVLGDAVIVATGGLSYPATGSTGDGYKWAAQLGHTIIPVYPGLVPLEVKETWVKEVQGLSLKNVQVKSWAGSPRSRSARMLGEEFGEMLFTHFGVSGPIILSLSSLISRYLFGKDNNPNRIKSNSGIILSINLKPALSPEQLDRRIQRDLEAYTRKQFKNALFDLLPRALVPIIVSLSKIPADKPANQITREERLGLASLLMDLQLTVTGTRPIDEAIVTAGGVSVKEVNPRTMASRLVEGLYFAGEILDIDGYTGGYNLQAAFSTGYVAGQSAGQSVLRD